MSVKLSDLTEKLKPITPEIRGEKVELSVPVGFYTGPVKSAFSDKTVDYEERCKTFIEENLKGWDITDENGVLLPINRESLDRMDIFLLDEIVAAMIRGVSPNPTSSQG